MNIGHVYSKRRNGIQYMLMVLILCGSLAPLPAFSASTSDMPHPNNAGITVNDNQVTAIQPHTLASPAVHNSKQVLNDDSRDLSAFFILGIAINVVMAVSFAWWFSREWRRSKK